MKRFPFAVFVTILCVLQWTKGKHMSDIVKEKIADLNRAVSVEQEEADKAALQFCTSSTAPVTNFNPAKIMPLEFCESTSKCYNETNGQLEEFVQLKQEIKGLKELADKKVILIAKSRFILMNESHNLLSIKQKLSDIETKKSGLHDSHKSAKEVLSHIRSILYSDKMMLTNHEQKLALFKEPLAAPLLRFMETTSTNTPLNQQAIDEVVKKLDQLLALLENSTNHQAESIEGELEEYHEKQQRSEARLAQVKEKLEHEDAERLRITNLVEEKVGIAENAFESYSRSAQYCLKQHEVFVQEVLKRKSEKKLFEIINTKLESLSFFREEEVEKNPPLLQNQTNSTNTGILRDDKKNTQDRGLENNFVEGEIVKAEKFDDKLKHGKEARKENQSVINVTKLSDPTLHHVPKMSSIQNQQGLKSKSMQHEKDVLTQQINRAVEISKLTSEGMKLSPGQEVKISESGSIVSKGNALAMKNYHVQNNAISRAEEKTKQFIAKKIKNLKQHP